ncbi:MAG: hypothetical protein QOK40_3038 [Miltoncostaeaceae bacterium]|nr:hypothetical protein [Miltoncostaeaceae bacterium]
MRHRRFVWATLAVVAALALPLMAAGPALAAAGTPQFDRCLAQNGLSAAPADQAGKVVQVCKTVRVTKVTTYAWTLTKTPSPSALTLAPGQSALVAYTLAATATPTVRWVVDGDVVVRNTGTGNATVSRVADTLALADGSTQGAVLSSKDFTLGPASAVCPCVCPPERSFHYRFTVDHPPATGTNTASADWSEKASGSSSFSAPVDFTDGPATNSVVWLRTATLTDAYGSPPAGLLVGVPDQPGPFTLSADQPSSLSVTLSSRIRNESLACPGTGTVNDTATLTSAAKPEVVNKPTTSGQPPAVSLTATASVVVTAQGCATQNQKPPTPAQPTGPPPPAQPTAAGPPPPAAPQAQAAPPQAEVASVPSAPLAGAAPVAPAPKPVVGPACVRAALSARIVGPRRVTAGQQVTWRITVRNVGRTLARSVRLTDRIPSGFSLVRSTPRAGFLAGVARFSLPDLRPGHAATVRLTMHASRDTVGQRLQRARVAGACEATESAVAPVTVSAVAGAVSPAVTG